MNLEREIKIMYSLYFDGASKGNPGNAGYGSVLYNADGHEIDCVSGFCQQAQTNNYAEYEGLVAGLRLALKHGIQRLKVYGDSKLVIEQMKGNWSVKSTNLVGSFQNCKSLEKQFFHLEFHHIKRHLNQRADALANAKIP